MTTTDAPPLPKDIPADVVKSKRGSHLAGLSDYSLMAQQWLEKQMEVGDRRASAQSTVALFEDEYQEMRKLHLLQTSATPKHSIAGDKMELSLSKVDVRKDAATKVKKRASSIVPKTQPTPFLDVPPPAPEEHYERLVQSVIQDRGAFTDKKLSKFVYLTGDDYDHVRARHAYLDPDFEKELQKRYNEDEAGFADMLCTRNAFHKKWRNLKKKTQALIRFIGHTDEQQPYRSTRSLILSADMIDSSETSSSDSYDDSSGDSSERAKSVYDLPLESQKKFLIQRDSEHVTSLTSRLSTVSGAINRWKVTSSGHKMKDDDEKRSALFSRLRPEILIAAIDKRTSLAYVRPLALKRVLALFELKLKLLHSNYGCDTKVFVMEDLPHKVFSWVERDFTARRKLNTIWIDILMKAIEPACLQTLKFQKDVAELRRYMTMYINAFLDESNVVAKDFIEAAENCSDFLQLFPLLEDELEQRGQQLMTHIHQLTTKAFAGLDATQSRDREFFMRELECLAVIYPIELRYQLAHHSSRTEYAIEMAKKMEGDQRVKIKYYENLYLEEIRRSQSTMNTYYVQIQYYRAQVHTVNHNYELEVDRLESAILRKRSAIEKMEMTKTFCLENLERLKTTLETLESLPPASSRHRSTTKPKSHFKKHPHRR